MRKCLDVNRHPIALRLAYPLAKRIGVCRSLEPTRSNKAATTLLNRASLRARAGRVSRPGRGLAPRGTTRQRRKDVKNPGNGQRGSSRLFPALLLLAVVLGAAYFVFTRNASVQNAFHFVKESTQDATTTSQVRTALLLSKHVSPYDIKVETTQAEVTLDGQVPSEQIKAVAGAIALDTSGVKEVHNKLSINPSTAR